MDIYEYLKLDHECVAQLFKQFENSKLQERRRQIAALISQELLAHAHAEQETFYRALKQFDSTKDEAFHGQTEHKEIEEQISLILHSKEFGAVWTKKVDKLKEIVEHHVNEEEGKIFRNAQKVLSQEDAYDLKEQMHYLKQHMLLALKKEESTLERTIKKEEKIKKEAKDAKNIVKKPILKKPTSPSQRLH